MRSDLMCSYLDRRIALLAECIDEGGDLESVVYGLIRDWEDIKKLGKGTEDE